MYVALTSKHHEGLALWPSKQIFRHLGASLECGREPTKRDVLGDLTARFAGKI